MLDRSDKQGVMTVFMVNMEVYLAILKLRLLLGMHAAIELDKLVGSATKNLPHGCCGGSPRIQAYAGLGPTP